MKRILIATRNIHKFKEIGRILSLINFELVSLADFRNIPEVKEDCDTFRDNAIKKAREISKATGILSISDDSGLEVEALGGQPGVYSSRFSAPGATDEKNIKKLINLLKDIPVDKRDAQFVCWVALADKGRILATTNGICRGKITDAPYGEFGFGYDPVFIPKGYRKTFAQLGPGVKNKISHRYKAFSKMREVILKLERVKIL